jgi:Ca-activated chloride channel homolog
MNFVYPLLLLFPFLFFTTCYARKKSTPGYPLLPSIQLVLTARRTWKQTVRKPLLISLLLLTVALLAVVAARPITEKSVSMQIERRNIFFSLDISKSMESRDYVLHGRYISRLTAVKAVVEQFLEERPEDRFGFVIFGSAAYLQAPLTHDHTLLKDILRGVTIGLAGDGTAIGDGLGVAVKRLVKLPRSARAIILVTDGASNSGRMNPDQAAEIAKKLGIVVHTVGVGSPNSSSRVGDFDEETLKKIANDTGGRYFHAQNTEELQAVADMLNELASTERRDPPIHPSQELYPTFGWLALLLLLTYIGASRLVFMKVP